jgi:hypothetical protein
MGGVALEHPTRRSFGNHPAASDYASRPPHSDPRAVPPSVEADLNVARRSGANVLLVGPEQRLSGPVSTLVPDLYPDAPFQRRDRGPMFVPASSRAAVVIRDVDALTQDEQLRLLDRLGAAAIRPQVVSTASTPLLPLVEAGAFNASLYYRLNTIYIDLR